MTQRSPSSLRRYDLAIRDRLTVASTAFGLPQVVPDRSAEECLRTLLGQEAIAAPMRAGICLLAATGRYPTEAQVAVLQPLLDDPHGDLAWGELLKALRVTPRRSLGRRLLPSTATLVDISRTSRATTTTGIPRVALGVAGIAQALDFQLIVWEDGVPGLVELSPDRAVTPSPATWFGGRRRRGLLLKMKKAYWSLMSQISLWPGGAGITRAARAIASPVARALFSRNGPGTAILMTRCRYVMPEVPHSATTSRLLAWIALGSEVHVAVAVHDLLPVNAPEFFAKDQRLEHIEFCRLIARSESVVVASPHLVAEVKGVALAFGSTIGPAASQTQASVREARCPSIEQVPYGIDVREWHVTPQAKRSNAEFLMIGSMEARKNHRLALLALGSLAGRGMPTTLHVVGARRPISAQTRDALRYARGQGVDVVEHAGADDGTLRGLMDNCVASMYLSWAEGFGLPVLESLAFGLPVIASDIPSNRDHATYGGVVLVAPDRPRAVADVIGRMLTSPDYLSSLREGIRVDALPYGFDEWANCLLGGDPAAHRLPA